MALGMIEVFGFATAIVVADKMAKAADVKVVAIDKNSIFALFFFLLIAIGAITGLGNGIPMRTKTVDNDGYNALSLRKDPHAMRAFWLQLKVSQQTTLGIRLKDMPEEWFSLPGDEAMQNSMVAGIGVFACNRLMDQHKFREAGQLMAHILCIDSGMVGLHRNLLVCDRIYCELIHENRPAVLSSLYTAEQKKFMQSMKNFPTVIRTEYAYALLADKDTAKANAHLNRMIFMVSPFIIW